VRFGFFAPQDTTRYCYLRLRRLKQAIKDPELLDGAMRELGVPSTGQPLSSVRDKMAAIDLHIERLRGDKTSLWFGVPPAEILAAALFTSRKVSASASHNLFSEVSRKEDLAAPIANWLNYMGFVEYRGLTPGTPRVDVVAYQVGRLMTTPRILGVELLAEPDQLRPALERMGAFAPFTHAMYLACAPALAADVLVTHAKGPRVDHWEPDAFRNQLVTSGFGLLLLEGDAVSEVLAPKERKPDVAKLMDIARATIAAGRPR
jgi:hypothetical protein